MSRLLSANFARLFRSVWFWACGLLMLGYSLWQAADMLSWAYSMWSEWSGDFITSRAGDFAVPVVIVLPVLSAMFLGAEYHYNTVRNKIIAGYSRWQVYLANLITVTAAGLIYAGAHVLVLVASGFFIRMHVWDMGALTLRLLCCLPFMLAVSALSTLLAMLIRLRALPVLVILLSVALLWLPQQLHMRLSNSPELVVTEGVEIFNLQTGVFDAILPNMMPLLLTMGVYGLAKKGVKSSHITFATMALGFVLGMLGLVA